LRLRTASPAFGRGEELRIDTASLGGGAFEGDGGLVHLFALAQTDRENGRPAR
jgi:hypothetical protein